MSKMYICVLDDVPADMVPVICAHASLSAYLRAIEGDDMDANMEMTDWASNSFKKVVCKVTPDDVRRCVNEIPGHVLITESSLGNRTVAIVLFPKDEFPKFVKFFPLYKVA